MIDFLTGVVFGMVLGGIFILGVVIGFILGDKI